MIAPGEMLGTHRLIERIGAGGMGEVWKAEDTRLGRVVAIKILPQSVAADVEAIGRMRREARTAAQLNHPNIATIFSFDEAEGRTFIVMEFVDGEPLTELIRRGKMSEADLCRIGRGVAEALGEAHEKGVVHRDIKPDNVIVRGTRVKVLDFGIAKRVGLETTHPDDPTSVVTQQGMILGTVHYMSPEQALGKPIDARTDIFSLGVVLYEAATGKLPFGGETITETITQIVRDEPLPARRLNPSLSTGLNAIIERCLRKERDERFASGAALADALDRQLGAAPTEALTTATTAPLPAHAGPSAFAPTLREARAQARLSSTAPTERIASAPARPKSKAVPLLVAAAVVVLAALAALPLLRSSNPTAQAPREASPLVAKSAPASSTVSVSAPPPAVESHPEAQGAEVVPRVMAPSVASPPQQETAAAPATTSATETQEPSGNGAYERGVALLASGDRAAARAAFEEAVKRDPHDARSHFRWGEIALLNHNAENARTQFQKALEDPDRLERRERQLVDLGLALLRGDRVVAAAIARQIRLEHPFDPDVMAIHREYGFLLREEGLGRRRRR